MISPGRRAASRTVRSGRDRVHEQFNRRLHALACSRRGRAVAATRLRPAAQPAESAIYVDPSVALQTRAKDDGNSHFARALGAARRGPRAVPYGAPRRARRRRSQTCVGPDPRLGAAPRRHLAAAAVGATSPASDPAADRCDRGAARRCARFRAQPISLRRAATPNVPPSLQRRRAGLGSFAERDAAEGQMRAPPPMPTRTAHVAHDHPGYIELPAASPG